MDNLEEKLKKESKEFINKMRNEGLSPISAFEAVLQKVIKETEDDAIKPFKLSLEAIADLDNQISYADINNKAANFEKAKKIAIEALKGQASPVKRPNQGKFYL